MSRPASAASAHYFATPDPVVPLMGALVRLDQPPIDAPAAYRPARASGIERRVFTVLDPCAGTGKAVIDLVRAIYGADLEGAPIDFHVIELEGTRFAELERAIKATATSKRLPPVMTHGDAFTVSWACGHERVGASLLFLNPPYDDEDRARLEARWLARFAPALCLDGVLLFVIPGARLAACATLLATHFAGLACFRFPDPEYARFGQVVVVGTKIATLLTPSPAVLAQVAEWAAAPQDLPVLRDTVPTFATVPTFPESSFKAGFSRWDLEPMDMSAITRAFTPWRTDRRGARAEVPGVLPVGGASGMRALKVQTAQPLHAGHIAAALACGIFDGVRLEPDDPASGLGPILLKAVFRRDWVPVERRRNEKGKIIGERERERPRLVITALDLRTGTYHQIKSKVERTDGRAIDRMTAADLLAHYARALLGTLHDRCPPLHDPANPAHTRPIHEFAEPLFTAQRDAVITVLKLLEEHGAALILGETGVGKTRMAVATLATMKARGVRRALVICPPHLVGDPWMDEIAAVWPEARAVLLSDIADVDAFAKDEDPRPLIGILAETSGKLCHGWSGIGDVAAISDPRHLGDTLPYGREVIAHRVAFTLPSRRAARLAALEQAGKILPIARCPKCGTPAPAKPEVLSRARGIEGAGRCAHRAPIAHPNMRTAGTIGLGLAEALLPIFPSSDHVRTFCGSPGMQRLAAVLTAREKESAPQHKRVPPEILPCPACGKPHVDDGEWADRPHHTHVCLDDAAGAGCGLEWRLEHYARGILPPRAEIAWRALVASKRLHRFAWLMSGPLRARKFSLAEGALGRLLTAIADDELTASIARAIYRAAPEGDAAVRGDPTGPELRETARRLMLTMQPAGEVQAMLAVELWDLDRNDVKVGLDPWLRWSGRVAILAGHRPMDRMAETAYVDQAQRVGDGSRHYGFARGDRAAALAAFEKFVPLSGVDLGPPCGEPLYQAIPSPRRVPLSAYLAKRYPGVVQLVAIDEVHECGDQDSAQSAAMGQWQGTPMIGLTGSLSNGYAACLFFILYTMSPAFRAEFGRGDIQAFISKYGCRSRWVEYRDKSTKEVVAFGTNSDRVERRVKTLGDAPGTLPSLTIMHLLAVSVFVHLEDLGIDLPPCTETVEMIDPGPVLGPIVRAARQRLLERIKADRYTKRAGALFGAMGNEWGSADLAGVGNCDDGIYRLAYPEEAGGAVVAEVHVDPDLVLPKEQRLLEIVREELAAGRNVLISAWHASTPIYNRIAKLVERETGEPCVVLQSSKVTAKKRDEWIVREVIGKKRRVMVANPAAIGTGFNKLTWFATVVHFQPPGCDPKADRQLMGRVRRPGQKRPQRVFRLLYKGTSQELVHQLLLWKVAASRALDGLDDTAALRAAGVDVMDDEMSGFALGHQLFRMALREMGENPDA